MALWMQRLSPDIVYCFGWSYLLRQSILAIPRFGVIGYHPTKLPQNRGRHPIIWALALGLKETASSFFYMDEGADSGDLISQETLEITQDDTAKTLYARLQELALEQVEVFTAQLVSGENIRLPQCHEHANYWRKRNTQDGQIDWRMPAEGIYNLVRALTHPYVGAHFLHHGQEVCVWACKISEGYRQEDILHVEPGRVLSCNQQHIDVRCGDGVICLMEHEMLELPLVGAYL
jgi:methionyl-tRNA formyltransferase